MFDFNFGGFGDFLSGPFGDILGNFNNVFSYGVGQNQLAADPISYSTALMAADAALFGGGKNGDSGSGSGLGGLIGAASSIVSLF